MVDVFFVLVLYIFGFVLLYGVVRLAVKHAIEDATHRQHRRALPEEIFFPGG
ncbi:hypothetical protein [Micromonospora polyrhachis]|uniref:Uncharacterized protein n=1 Tax=Micromonospora polyrhachis TaxID=1282883 RepID=A0A7W7WQD1_9ACTN|nr:hypothetical protein [Micromonospora polyrhachis]MBB4959163.1 hypothetical protein [Micromonospora polyrhachis]